MFSCACNGGYVRAIRTVTRAKTNTVTYSYCQQPRAGAASRIPRMCTSRAGALCSAFLFVASRRWASPRGQKGMYMLLHFIGCMRTALLFEFYLGYPQAAAPAG